MAKYNVEIVETLSRIVEIEANSYEDAESIAEEMYDKADIILDWEDKEDTNYKPYPSQKIKDSFFVLVNFDKKERKVYIGCENTPLAKYPCETKEDLKSAITTYISNFIEFEPINAIKERKAKDKVRDER